MKRRKIEHEGSVGASVRSRSRLDDDDGGSLGCDGESTTPAIDTTTMAATTTANVSENHSYRGVIEYGGGDIPVCKDSDEYGVLKVEKGALLADCAVGAGSCAQPGSDVSGGATTKVEEKESSQIALGSCTPDETLAIRRHARKIGLENFMQEAVLECGTPLHNVCTAFGVPWPDDFSPDSRPDAALVRRLRKAVKTDMGNRIRLLGYDSVHDAAGLISDARNIMVITGAGMSTSLNIPDFRSEGGLYSKLREMGFEDPENVFSRDTLEHDPKSFFSVASMILPPHDGKFTPAHAFLKFLQDKQKLLTLYTQNIDGIDIVAGIRRDKLIQLHGSFDTATCIKCGYQVQGEDVLPKIRDGQIPGCAKCYEEHQSHVDRTAALRAQNDRPVRRKTRTNGREPTADHSGIMRPDIVFMDEPLRPYLKRFERDCTQVDLVIVMGTSLPVEPVNTMPTRVPANVPQIYIGRNQVSPEENRRIEFDIQLLGDCDVVTHLLANRCGWDLHHEMLPYINVFHSKNSSTMRYCHEIWRADLTEYCGDPEDEPSP